MDSGAPCDNAGGGEGRYPAALSAGGCTSATAGCFGNGGAGHGNTADPSQISGVFSRSWFSCKLAQVSDGTSNVILYGEVRPNAKFDEAYHLSWATSNGLWIATTAPINFPNAAGEAGIGGCVGTNQPNVAQGFKSKHKGGAHFTLCDGTVRFINQNINYVTYQKLGDRRDGRQVGDF